MNTERALPNITGPVTSENTRTFNEAVQEKKDSWDAQRPTGVFTDEEWVKFKEGSSTDLIPVSLITKDYPGFFQALGGLINNVCSPEVRQYNANATIDTNLLEQLNRSIHEITGWDMSGNEMIDVSTDKPPSRYRKLFGKWIARNFPKDDEPVYRFSSLTEDDIRRFAQRAECDFGNGGGGRKKTRKSRKSRKSRKVKKSRKSRKSRK